MLRYASSTMDLNLGKVCHPLAIYISVTFAIELITGLALIIPALLDAALQEMV